MRIYDQYLESRAKFRAEQAVVSKLVGRGHTVRCAIGQGVWGWRCTCRNPHQETSPDE